MSRKYAIEFDGQFANCDNLKINDMTVEQIRTDVIDECIKTITNLCGGLANINIIGALEKLKEQNNEQ